MLHELEALSPALFIEASGDEVVQRREVDVCKPRRGIITDRQVPWIVEQRFPFCGRKDDQIQHLKESFILYVPVEQIPQFVEIDGLIKMPDIQFYEETTVSGACPFFNRLPGILNAAPRKVPAAVPVHLSGFQILNGKHDHPLNDVVLQPCNLYFPLFPT